MCESLIKSNERSEYSHIGLDIFFQENLFTLNFDFSRFYLYFFKFSAFPLLKERQTPLSNSKSVKVMKT